MNHRKIKPIDCKNYKDVDFKTLCNDFGYDTNWNLLK